MHSTHFIHVAVGSTNPVKIAAVRAVLERVVDSPTVIGIYVESGVAAQPRYLQAGVIPHALAFAMINPGNTFVSPAKRSDGPSSSSYAPPQKRLYLLDFTYFHWWRGSRSDGIDCRACRYGRF